MSTFPFTGDTLSQVEALYVGYFGRAGDPQGTNFWSGALNAGFTIQEAAASFSVQAESEAEYPFLANPFVATQTQITSFITSVYEDLFDRAPDAAGLNFWESYLSSNLGTPQAVGTFILAVVSGAQNSSAGQDQTTITNKVTAADFLTQSFASAGINFDAGSSAANTLAHNTIMSITSDPATLTVAQTEITKFVMGLVNPSDQTFTFTAATDNFTTGTGGDTYSAPLVNAAGPAGPTLGPQQSLTTGDVAIDSGFTNVLNAQLTGRGSVDTTVTLEGIQTWNLQSLNVGNGGGPSTALNIIDGNISGMTVLNDNNSMGSIRVTGLPSPPGFIGLTNDPGGISLEALIAQTGFGGAPWGVSITLNNVGTSAQSSFLLYLGSGTAVGYATYYIDSQSGPSAGNFLELSQLSGTALSNIVITGNALLELSVDNAQTFKNVVTIDASVGPAVTLTGALDGTSGLLTDDSSLKTILGGGLNSIPGTGNFFDLSGPAFTAAVLNGMFINGGGSTTSVIVPETNTVVLDHSVIDGTTAVDTLLNVSIIGDSGGPAGQVTFSNFGPPAADTLSPTPNELKFFGPLTAGSDFGEIINQGPIANPGFLANTFTVDLGAQAFANVAWTINATNSASPNGNVLDLIFGSTSSPATGLDGQWTVNNWQIINITAQGGGETLGGFNATLSPASAPFVSLYISGASGTSLGFNSLMLQGGSNSGVNITGGVAVLVGPTNVGGINAVADTGGLLMSAPDTTLNVQIVGSGIGANALYGSLGNDTLQGGSGGGSFFPVGGADEINLEAAPSRSDLIYFGSTSLTPPLAFVVSGQDDAFPGFWGIGAEGNATLISALFGSATSGGTSASMSTVSNFRANGNDTLVFETGAWANPLVKFDGQTAIGVSSAVLQEITSTDVRISASTTVLEDAIGTYANASALAAALTHSGSAITLGGTLAAGHVVHVLIAYSTGIAVNIADVDLQATSSSSSTQNFHVYASDIVQLTAVSLSQLTSHSISFI